MIFSVAISSGPQTALDQASAAVAIEAIPKSWFVIAKSASLRKGRHRAVRFLEKDWVLFRDENGRVGMVSRYCSHMGADLNQGCVHAGRLHCPLHGWEFDAVGKCRAKIPEEYSRQAALPFLPAEEWAGMIFVFPAPTPDYALPRSLVAPDAMFSATRRLEIPFPWLLPALNTFDLSHFTRVHHREFVEEPGVFSQGQEHLAIRFRARILKRRLRDQVMRWLGFHTVDVSIDCWGGSVLIMRNHNTQVGAVLSVEPLGPAQSHLYMTAFNIGGGKSVLSRLLLRAKLEIGRMATRAFLQADVPMLTGMRPLMGVMIPGQDDVAIRFWNFYQAQPKANL